MRLWGLVTIVACGLLPATQAPAAAPLLPMAMTANTTLRVTPVVVFGHDGRRQPQDFAAEHNLDSAEVIRDHVASGLIQCGNAHGAGQLTLTDDVVTTAAHVFFDETGRPRAATCNFTVVSNGREVHVPIDLTSIVAGSTHPYDVDIPFDWAVARLTHGLTGVRPYGISEDIHREEPATFVARGHVDWGDAKKLSMQQCTMHGLVASGEQGTREFSFDCDTGDGASGGALMMDRDSSMIGAILVGWRSNKPFSAQPFSATHYNFAVTLEGDFRQAVYSMARKLVSQK